MPKVKGGRPTRSDKRAGRTKNKTKSKSTAIVPVPPKPLKTIAEVLPPEAVKKLRLTRKRLKKLEALESSQFKMDLPSLMEVIEDDHSIDEIQKKFLRASLMTVINVIPEIENKLHTNLNEGGAYAMKALIDLGMEIFHNIRALANTQLVALRISETVVDPAFQNLAHIYVSSYHALRTQMESLVDEKDQPEMRRMFQDMTTVFGESLNNIRIEMKARIAQEIE